MLQTYSVSQLREAVAPIAKRFGVKSVYAFGSYGRHTAKPTSDLDIRIERGAITSLFELADFRLTLEEALSIPVDIVTSDIPDKQFVQAIAPDEVLLYAES